MVIAVSAGACYDQVVLPDFESDGRISITNDEAALDARVTYPHRNIPIAPTVAASGAASGAPAMAPSRNPEAEVVALVRRLGRQRRLHGWSLGLLRRGDVG